MDRPMDDHRKKWPIWNRLKTFKRPNEVDPSCEVKSRGKKNNTAISTRKCVCITRRRPFVTTETQFLPHALETTTKKNPINYVETETRSCSGRRNLFTCYFRDGSRLAFLMWFDLLAARYHCNYLMWPCVNSRSSQSLTNFHSSRLELATWLLPVVFFLLINSRSSTTEDPWGGLLKQDWKEDWIGFSSGLNKMWAWKHNSR